MLQASHQSMRASKYAKITIEHRALTRLSTRSHVCLLCRGKHLKSSASHSATSSTLKSDSAPTQPPRSLLIMFCMACNMVFPSVIQHLSLVKSVQKTIRLLLVTYNLYQTTLSLVARRAKHGGSFIPLLSRMFKFPAWVCCRRKTISSGSPMTSPPHGNSVNDAIPPSAFSLQYESVDTAINAIMELGPGLT